MLVGLGVGLGLGFTTGGFVTAGFVGLGLGFTTGGLTAGGFVGLTALVGLGLGLVVGSAANTGSETAITPRDRKAERQTFLRLEIFMGRWE
jgi:hypothetical protein